MITTGNLLAGILALAYLNDAASAGGSAQEAELWVKAAWMVFLGMLCDGLDGRVARWTRSSSAFGAQLDSLADVVTFGVVPALLARSILIASFPNVGKRLLTGFVVVYLVGAALRLARYNVESARVSSEGARHVTRTFRGLPTPAAAGTVASLVLLTQAYSIPHFDWAILLLTPVLGLLMISRLPYSHVANRVLEGHRALPTIVLLAFVVFLGVIHFEETIGAVFLLYTSSGAVIYGLARLTGRPAWVFEEEDDETLAAEDAPADGDGRTADTPAPFGRG